MLSSSTASPAPAPSPAASPASRIELIERSFSTSKVQPVALPIAYRLGLLLLCGLMIVLPLLYLGLVGLACYGVYYHAAYNIDLFADPGGKAGFVAYFAPLLIGAILVFFMIKPLFAPRAKSPSPIKLKPGEEPILEGFVNRICEAVNAPKPRSIAIDGEVNASASFEEGILAFFAGRLRLTVGLPLLAGMPVHSVGGILAHEFGHFAQGGGMRLTYIIRMINHWFARVVYGRDRWDEWIESTSKDSDFRVMILLGIARAFIFAVRKILWLLMQVGQIASCYMARQMEYDADSYEARFAGSQVFATTSDRLVKLGYASQVAFSQLREHYETQKLSDDLPSFIEHSRRAFTQDQLSQMDRLQAERTTKLLDTHPCDADRIAHANKLASPGIFALDEPATLLLVDFDSASREVTKHHYSEILGIDTSRIRLLDNEAILAAEAQKQAELAAARSFLGGAATLELPLDLAPVPGDDSSVGPAELQAALARLQQRAFDSEAFQKEVDAAFARGPARYNDSKKADYEGIATDASHAFSLAVRARAQQLQGSERERLLADYELFRALCSLVPDWFKIRERYAELDARLQRWNQIQPTETDIQAAATLCANPIHDGLQSLSKTIDTTLKLPFADEDSDLTIVAYLHDTRINTGHTVTDAYHRAAHYLGRFHNLYQRVLGRLALEVQPIIGKIKRKEATNSAAFQSPMA